MNFWAHQEDAKRRTVRLIALYAVSVVILSLAAGYIFTVIWEIALDSRSSLFLGPEALLDPQLYLGAGLFLLVVAILSLFAPVSLFTNNSGAAVAESFKAARVDPRATDPGERRLCNVVEEMALASGMPVPPVYILQNEPGINAFAAGGDINNAVIGVTRGTVDLLSREELQAVVAHEFSHILNGDMKLDLCFAQLLFGLMCVADFSGAVMKGAVRGSSRRGGGKNRESGVLVLLLLALSVYLIGGIMSLAGTLVQKAVNRQREFLADASSVQFTRSNALASALKKIGGLAAGSSLSNTAMTGSYRHLFFCSASAGFFDTHPPLEARIRRINPQWDGTFTAVDAGYAAHQESSTRREEAGTAGEADSVAADQWRRLRNKNSSAWLETVRWTVPIPVPTDEPQPALYTQDEAEQLLRGACREPLEASYMILGLLLDSREEVANRQFRTVPERDARNAIRNYHQAFAVLERDLWLTLIELAIPALKTFSPRQFEAFREQMGAFINADGEFSFKEWVLQQLVVSQAGAHASKARPPATTGDITHAAGMVLTALARFTPGYEGAKCAFQAGVNEMKIRAEFSATLLNPAKLSESVAILAKASEQVKRRFLHAANCVAEHDRRITGEETMFLRVLSLCLGIPAPSTETGAAPVRRETQVLDAAIASPDNRLESGPQP